MVEVNLSFYFNITGNSCHIPDRSELNSILSPSLLRDFFFSEEEKENTFTIPALFLLN